MRGKQNRHKVLAGTVLPAVGGKLWPWLGISMALHATFCLVSLLKFPVREASPAPTFVEVLPSPGKGSGRGDGRTPFRRRTRKTDTGPSLSDLGIGWASKGVPAEAIGEGWGKGIGRGKGSGSAVLETLRRTVPLEKIREQVDSALDYPPPFRNKGIAGTVTAEVIFGPQGKLLKRTARSESRYLRVHILRVLREALSEGLPPTYAHGESLHLRFRFDFLLSDRAQLGNGLVPGDKDGFHFQRVGRPFGQWKIGPLAGFWMVPAIAIDPSWFLEKAEKLVSRKAEIDPLEIYRNDPEF